MLDLLEAINQKVDETGGLTASEILGLIKLSKNAALQTIRQLSTASGGSRIIVDVALAAVERASDVYIEYLENDAEGASRFYQQQTSNELIQKCTTDLLEGKRVLLVAHSQGNLFANDAVNTIISNHPEMANSIGIVGVANPAGLIVGSNEYVTAHDDRVIDALRVTHTVLPSNIDNDPGVLDDKRDMLNHGFLTSYLASELTTEYVSESTLSSRERINGVFLNLIHCLNYPGQEVGTTNSCSKRTPLNDTGFVTCGNNTSYSLSCPQTGFPGQDAEYGLDATNNDDSDGHAGFSFTKLDFYGNPLPADAPSWSCVKDNVTNLVWEVKTESGLRHKTNTYSWFEPDADINMGNEGIQDAGNCVVDSEDIPISCDTNSYIRKIRTKGLCGRSDWRLPDREELHSIRDYSVSWPGPAIDTQYFPHTETEYWTYNTRATDNSKAWTYGYSIQGGTSYRDKGAPQRVRLVSGKETLYPSRTSVCWYYDPEERFQVIDYDAVIDRYTGLMWNTNIPGTHKWEDVLNLVPLANEGWYENFGYKDWRIPNTKELASIMDLGCSSTTINPAVFPGMWSRNYWSSTSTAGHTNIAWFADYATGIISSFGRKVQISFSHPNSFGVLLVRDIN